MIPLDPHNPAKAKKLKQYALLGGVAVLAIIFLISRRSATSSSTGTGTAGTAASSTDPNAASGYSDSYGTPSTFADNGASASNLADAVNQGLGGVQTALQNLQSTVTPNGSVPATADPGNTGPTINLTVQGAASRPRANGSKRPGGAKTNTRTNTHTGERNTTSTHGNKGEHVGSHGGASHGNHSKHQPKHNKKKR